MARCIECGDLVGVEHDLGVDVPGRAADRLDQRGLAAEEAFLVGVEDADHRDLGQVEPFAEQVHADQGVEGPLAQLAEDRHALEGVELGVQPLAPQPLLLEVAREVLGQPLGERGDSTRSPLAARFLTSSSRAGTWPRAGSTRTIGIDQAGRADHLLDDLAARHRDLVVARRGRDEEPPRELLLPLVEPQRPVVQRAGEPEAVLDERALAAEVAGEHPPDLRHRDVRLVDESAGCRAGRSRAACWASRPACGRRGAGE